MVEAVGTYILHVLKIFFKSKSCPTVEVENRLLRSALEFSKYPGI